MNLHRPVGASFRDPSGFVFRSDDAVYRAVTTSYLPTLKLLQSSGLYGELTQRGLLIPHEDAIGFEGVEGAVIRPEQVPFISYPYEWSFGQLKDAALLTLEAQTRALERGMTLKDASAYNVQFHKGKPVLIDTLSFDPYEPDKPWIAYAQFCRHFLAPLALASFCDIRLLGLLRVHIDGVPLQLASHLLPTRTRFQPGLLMHLHGHAKGEGKSPASGTAGSREPKVSLTGLKGLVDSLRGTVAGLDWKPSGTEWADYPADNNYSKAAMASKRALVEQALREIRPAPMTCWDLGANSGEFSRIAAAQGVSTVAFDVDPAAVQLCYEAVRKGNETRLLPLLQDLFNPSPAQGWSGEERDSLFQRGPADVVLALALVHHLAIGNNVPFAFIAKTLARIGKNVIIEFVPKDDSQVQRMLRSRVDIFDHYDLDSLVASMAEHFTLIRNWPIDESRRTLLVFVPKERPA